GEGIAIGGIQLRRTEVQLFSERQIELLKTFADQAVIAVENVRLFTELQAKNRALTQAHAQVTETLERQTATSEILRVISSAHTDAQPVFDTIVQSAARLCNAANAAVFRVEGGMLYHPANYGGSPEALAAARARYPRPVGTDTGPGLAILARSPIQFPDVEDPSLPAPVREAGHVLGFRSCVAVPMLSAGDAFDAAIHRIDGDVLRLVAHEGPIQPDAVLPLTQGTFAGHVVRERRAMHVADLQAEADVYPVSSEFARNRGFRTILGVPLLRGTEVRGTITIRRSEVRLFTDRQAELLKTFADQAVIAIENVRLFQELEARTHELTRSVGELRALGEVGQAISSTLDLQTVLRTIVARATQLAGVDAGVIYEYDEQGEVFVPRATERLEAEIVGTLIAAPVRKGEGVTGRLAEAQEPIQLSDILEAPAESRVRDTLGRAGYRALLAVPLVSEDHLLGGLTVFRKTPGEFAPEVIDLLRTFATQ